MRSTSITQTYFKMATNTESRKKIKTALENALNFSYETTTPKVLEQGCTNSGRIMLCGGPEYLRVFSVEVVSCHHSVAYNFGTAPTSLGNLCAP